MKPNIPLTSIRGSLGPLAGGLVGELPEDAASMVACLDTGEGAAAAEPVREYFEHAQSAEHVQTLR